MFPWMGPSLAGTVPGRRELHWAGELGPGTWGPHKKLWPLVEGMRLPQPRTHLETPALSGGSSVLCFEDTLRRTKGRSIKSLSGVQPTWVLGFCRQWTATAVLEKPRPERLPLASWFPLLPSQVGKVT